MMETKNAENVGSEMEKNIFYLMNIIIISNTVKKLI